MDRRSWRAAAGVQGLILAGLIILGAARPAVAEPIARIEVAARSVEWEPLVDCEALYLRVAAPDGAVTQTKFAATERPRASFDDAGPGWPDGIYHWELIAVPRMDARLRQEIRAARTRHDDVELSRLQAMVPDPLRESGSFWIQAGSGVAHGVPENGVAAPRGVFDASRRPIAGADQQIGDDLIVTGAACVGSVCANGEAFGADDTLWLKQQVVRLKFEDTSTGGGLPTNDWQLTANDPLSGGAEKFSISDLTGAKTPFTIVAGAASDSLFVAASGNVGLGTATPAQRLHLAVASTPTVRLEQTGGTPRTWEVGAGNTSFFVRDQTNGSAVPLRIAAGAPTSSMELSTAGDFGLGTATPATQLHVFGTDTGIARQKVLVENASSTTVGREMFELRNNGLLAVIFKDTSVPQRWSFGTLGDRFIYNEQAHNGLEFDLSSTGNLIIIGSMTATSFITSSSRELKEGFVPVVEQAVLERLAGLPINEWSFKADAEHQRHIGPTAEDFEAAFGLGRSGQGLNLADVNGVALAAIRALHQNLQEQRQAMVELQAELSAQRLVIDELRAQLDAARGPQ